MLSLGALDRVKMEHKAITIIPAKGNSISVRGDNEFII